MFSSQTAMTVEFFLRVSDKVIEKISEGHVTLFVKAIFKPHTVNG